MTLTHLIAVAGVLLAALPALARAEYTPMLPKTGPTERVIVIDVSKDKNVGTDPYNGYWHFSESHDAILTICALQGLINRESTTKIYLTNLPGQIAWNPSQLGLDDAEDDATSAALADGLVPYPIEHAELDASKRFPALSYLMANYGHLVEGISLCPTTAGFEFDTAANSGGRSAALNACTFESLLPVTPIINKYLRDEGFELERVHDFRGMSNAEAMRWSMDRYLDHPNRNRQVVGVWSELGTHPSTMADYFVATHTFTYFLHRDHRWTEPFGVQVDDADELMKELLSPEHYPPGIPNIGCVEMSDCIPLIEELGYASVCGMFPNASMTSSIPTDPSSFTPADPPKVLEIDPNGIYLAWNGPDGDNINFGFHFNYPAMRRDPMTGQVPVAWRFNPYIIDLFPTLFAWYTQQGPGTIDLTSSLNDGGDPKTPEGRAYWIETYTHYLEASNGAIQVANFMGQFPNEHFHAMMGHVPLKAVVNGYHGVGERDSKLLLRDNEARTLYTNQIGFRGPKPSSIGHRFTGNAVIDLRQTIENDAVAGEPYFVVGRLPSECGLNGFSIAHHLTKRLQAQTDRTIYLVRVSDLAATLKAHRDRGSDYDGLAAELWQRVRQDAASDESITAFIDGLSSDDPLARRASAAGLRATDDARASDALLAVMDDEDEATRRLATAALARRGDPRAVDAVVAQFGEPGGEFIASHLHRFGDNGMIAADDVLKHAEDDATRRDAAVALAGFGTKGQPHVDTLAAALASADDRQAKLALIDALARTGDPAAVAPLIALIERPEIDDPDHSVRSAAVRALAMAGRESPETLPMLERALMLRRAADVKGLDSHPLRRAALLALERLGPDATDLADAIRPITGREGGRLRDLATRALAAVEATE